MKIFQITISLSDEEIETLKRFKSGSPKEWDRIDEFGIDYEIAGRLIDLKLIKWCTSSLEDVSITTYGLQILNQL